MTRTVRVAVSDESLQLAWPRRCPACGRNGPLTESTSRVGRVKSIRPNLLGGITMKSDVMYVGIPMCDAHAKRNTVANRILEKSPLMHFLRALSYIGALFALLMVPGLLLRPGALARIADLGVFLLVPAVGVLGCAAIVWARKNTMVWPVRFDPDMDVIDFRFRDERFAAAFKRNNPKVTDEELTRPPPWYRRSLPWKVLVLIAFCVFMGYLIRR